MIAAGGGRGVYGGAGGLGIVADDAAEGGSGRELRAKVVVVVVVGDVKVVGLEVVRARRR